MIYSSPIQYLTEQGLTISFHNHKLNVKPSHLVTQAIKDYIKQHKDSIKSELLVHSQNVTKLPQLAELSIEQITWLDQIADLLQVTPEYLLQHKLIDQYDLMELLDKEPMLIARCIRSYPRYL